MLTFSTETVDKYITRIYAFGTELMYLVEGTRENVLIDTGSGFGSLKAAVDSILAEHENTNPLSVLLTHGHVDHACGAGEFISAGIPVYMSPADRYIYMQHSDSTFRIEGLAAEDFEGHGYYDEKEDYIPSADIQSFRELKEGDRFELGGIEIETFACPGHTLGSLVFLIREENGNTYLLTGDACNTFTFLFQEYSTSIEEYEENLGNLSEKLKGNYDQVLLSHGDGRGYVGIIEDVCQVCERIKKGEVDSIPFSFGGSEGKIAMDPEQNAGKGNIVFHPDRIWKDKTVIK